MNVDWKTLIWLLVIRPSIKMQGGFQKLNKMKEGNQLVDVKHRGEIRVSLKDAEYELDRGA